MVKLAGGRVRPFDHGVVSILSYSYAEVYIVASRLE